MKWEQGCLFDDNPEYDVFTEKFKPKKTTDDCYTPPLVYDAIRDWACSEYGIDPACLVRTFYPGGDYERFDYPDGCVVLDNPPFSILSFCAIAHGALRPISCAEDEPHHLRCRHHV